MELTQQHESLLEELVSSRRESWATFPTNNIGGSDHHHFFPNGWNFESFDQTHLDLDLLASNNFSLLGLLSSSAASEPLFTCNPFPETENPYPLGLIAAAQFDYSPYTADIRNDNEIRGPNPTHRPDEYPVLVGDGGELNIHQEDHLRDWPPPEGGDKLCGGSVELDSENFAGVVNVCNNTGLCVGERRTMKSSKKVEGQPSKNLMAERRRRKRLNDRLSMLRSIVPKISKMDRTSILGDTIEYMKELLERIKLLSEEAEDQKELEEMKVMGNVKDPSLNEAQVRNPPKFDVERKTSPDTRIEICCALKPGLLLSTVNTLEALGLDIQHCVISCFNDFSLQASCSEATEHRRVISAEDVKQALFRNAGYGGRCL